MADETKAIRKPEIVAQKIFDAEYFVTNHEQKKLKVEQHETEPFALYVQLLEDFYAQSHFDQAQDFLAVVVEELNVVGVKNMPEHLRASLGVYEGYSDKQKYFKIFIPSLHAMLPILEKDFKVKDTTKVFLNTVSEIAVCEDPKLYGSIHKGSIVRISDAIIAARNKRPCNISKVLQSENLNLDDQKQTLKDAYKECIEQKLAIKPPPERVQAAVPVQTTIPSVFGIKPIYSKADDSENSPRVLALEKLENPKKIDEAKQKQIEIDKSLPSADDLEFVCRLGPSTTPVKPQKTEDEKIIENCFVKNGKTILDKQELKGLGKKKIFNSLSAESNKKVLTISKTLDSIGPVYDLPEDLREPKMVVVKTVQFTSADDYYKKIENDKIPAAHFCIDNDGIIYQFTDTKNLVKSYNPMIDEKSIYIAVTNIPYRNSVNTVAKIQNKNVLNNFASPNANFSFSNLGAGVQLAFEIKKDKDSLKRFYNRRNINREEVADEFISTFQAPNKIEKTFELSDGRETFPYYRLDYTIDQRLSLAILIKALCKSYNIPTNIDSIPKTRGYDVEVASGDFTGLACPMHFSLTEMEPLNFNDLMNSVIV